MNIGLFMGHPAHFHVLKNVAINLINAGHNVCFVAKKKDILEDLLNSKGFNYTLIREDRGNGKIDLIKSVLQMELNMCRFIKKNKINLLIGSTLSFAARVIMRIPVIVIGEDDASVVPRFANLSYPFANSIVTPKSCNSGKWQKKTINYEGYQELAYLHSNHFIPSTLKVKQYGIDNTKPYFILRFASLNAHHDGGICGISAEVAHHLINLLTPHGKIYITSERPLEPQFEQYRIHINPLDIHHVMAFASLYIGDSQTMAAEAGILGVPFVRFNDFVGRIGYLRELEDNYKLGYGIRVTKSNDEKLAQLPTGTDALYSVVEEILKMDVEQRTALFQERRQKMLSEKIDTSKFLTWFIENYPSSVEQTRKADTSFWNRFK